MNAGFTSMTARDISVNDIVRIPGRPSTAMEVAEISWGAVDVSIVWTDGSFSAIHGNTDVEVRVW